MTPGGGCGPFRFEIATGREEGSGEVAFGCLGQQHYVIPGDCAAL